MTLNVIEPMKISLSKLVASNIKKSRVVGWLQMADTFEPARNVSHVIRRTTLTSSY